MKRLIQALKRLFCKTNVIRSVCKHETILGGDGYFYCADCGAGRL
jgi:hypothetical protein